MCAFDFFNESVRTARNDMKVLGRMFQSIRRYKTAALDGYPWKRLGEWLDWAGLLPLIYPSPISVPQIITCAAIMRRQQLHMTMVFICEAVHE
jgi:hypothetical protein